MIMIYNITSYCLYDFSTCSKPEDDHCTTVGEPYTDLVIDLTKTCPNPEYEHFESFAHALYCKECEMILQPKFVNRIPCKLLEFLVRQDGTGIYVHSKCVKLDMTEHVRSTANKCGNWEKTYWRLWSECHFLSCTACKQPYPVKNSAMCLYHPEDPEYIPIGNLSLEQPTGRYPCCGEPAFRFQGCKFRMHVPKMRNDRDVRIEKIVRKYPKLTTVETPTLNYDRNITRLVNLDSGRKKILFELRMLSELNSKQTNLNPWTNSKNVKDNTEMAENGYLRMSTNEELEFTRFSKEYSWKLISIQELQREHESVIFNHITVNYNRSSSRVNSHLPRPFNPPRNIYTAVHSKMLEKINTNRAMPTKTIKPSLVVDCFKNNFTKT